MKFRPGRSSLTNSLLLLNDNSCLYLLGAYCLPGMCWAFYIDDLVSFSH